MKLPKFKKLPLKKVLSRIFIVLGLSFLFLAAFPILFDEAKYYFFKLINKSYQITLEKNIVQESVFGKLLGNKPLLMTPVNTDYAILIEKIGVNAPIVSGVSISNSAEYKNALKNGVAQAINSNHPSTSPGNVYLFAHASLNFWDLGKYAATFNLLDKMYKGDKVFVYYRNTQYEYETVGVEVYPGWNTTPITRPTIEPLLTIQTCYPPGTTLNRLVLTAKLIDVKPLRTVDE